MYFLRKHLIRFAALLPLLGGMASGSLIGEVVSYSPALGGVKLTAGGVRETALGIPFHQSPVVLGELGEVRIQTNSAGDFLNVRLTLLQPIGAPGAFNPGTEGVGPRFFLEFVTGGAAGERFPIAGSGDRWVVLAVMPEGALSAYFIEDPDVQPPILRDLVAIRPYWTMEDLVNDQFGVHDPQAPELSRSGDQIVLGRSSADEERILQWVLEPAGDVPQWGELGADGKYLLAEDDTVRSAHQFGIAPGRVFTVRRAEPSAVSWYFTGDASMLQRWSPPVPSEGKVTEWPLTLAVSDALKLNASGLSQFLNPAASAADRVDELIVWEASAGFDPRPERRFYLSDDEPEPVWREVGAPEADLEDYKLQPGAGYLIRRR